MAEEEPVFDLSNPDVTTKYRAAGDIVNKALEAVVAACKDGASTIDLCILGDKLIEDECGKLFNKKVKNKDGEMKQVDKGVAFPTCVSVNNICGHFSPLKSDTAVLLKNGDMVKVDLGAHFDGYITQGAHTVHIGDSKIEGRKADVLRAAHTAAEAAARAAQIGASNKEITDVIQKAAAAFKCEPLHGVLSHQVKRHVIDGNKVIMNKDGEDHVDDIELQLNEVYCMDLVMSTGEGKARETELRTTVYKRAVETSYGLKTQKARQFISEVNHRFPTLPFTLRSIEDEQVGRIGVSEANRHELLHDYPVLKERDGEYIAQFKFTLLLLPTGPKKITGLPFAQDSTVTSEFKVEDEALKKVLAVSMNPKKKKKPSKKSDDGKPDDGKPDDGKPEPEEA
eukprot:GEMP01045403.1.p1 GENE.GEMP01045403.1~~GEMP01045403.1.p1  ORF type:complete len:396 (+),score=113.48 GEMP01045403.1:71-1258(+)